MGAGDGDAAELPALAVARVPGRRALRLLRLRRGRSGSEMAAPPAAHDPGKPSRPRPHAGQVEGDGMAMTLHKDLSICGIL